MSVVVIAIAMLLVALLAAEPLLAAWPARRPKRPAAKPRTEPRDQR